MLCPPKQLLTFSALTSLVTILEEATKLSVTKGKLSS